jgi:hypothetical protein
MDMPSTNPKLLRNSSQMIYCVAGIHGFPMATTMNKTRKGFRNSGFYPAVCCTITNNDFAPPMTTRIDLGQADQRNQLQKRLKFSVSVPHMQLSQHPQNNRQAITNSFL